VKNIIDNLVETAKKHTMMFDSSKLAVREFWKNQYILQLTDNESPFNLKYILIRTECQGSCYVENFDENINEEILGKNLLELPVKSQGVMIAYIDSLFATIIRKPDDEYVLTGSNTAKVSKRSEIVCSETLKLLDNKTPKNGKRFTILNVGVVGGFLHRLTMNSAFEVNACDFYAKIVGTIIHGVKVENGTKENSSIIGERTLEMIAESDLALVTGMTLATNTLDDIIEVAKVNNTMLLIFAETGANFAEEYCKMGVDVVISEPYPFYMVGDDESKIKIYRKNWRKFD
jgi:hypothetical protein